jgi:hypothetical protein
VKLKIQAKLDYQKREAASTKEVILVASIPLNTVKPSQETPKDL